MSPDTPTDHSAAPVTEDAIRPDAPGVALHGEDVDPIAPLRAVLGQLQTLMTDLSQDQYVQKPVGTFHASIGGHVRHCLDHIEAIILGCGAGFVDYDKRARDTAIETNRNAAIREATRLSQGLDAVAELPISHPVVVSLMLCGDGPAIHWQSTIGRETAFVLSHTIHHGAMIAAMAEVMEVPVPDGFGLAPSTIAYRAGR